MKVTIQTITNFSFVSTSEDVAALDRVHDFCQVIVDTLKYAGVNDRVIDGEEQFNACDVLKTAQETIANIDALFAAIDVSELPILSINDDISSTILKELESDLEEIEEFD